MIFFLILSGMIMVYLPATYAELEQPDVKNIEYSIEHTAHTLITTWQVLNKQGRVTCDALGIQMFEISLSGRLKTLVDDQDVPDCTHRGDEIILRHDLTRFRVKPFRSYKLCISLPESHYNAGQCCPPFSLETFIPFNPRTALSTSGTTKPSSTTATTSTTVRPWTWSTTRRTTAERGWTWATGEKEASTKKSDLWAKLSTTESNLKSTLDKAIDEDIDEDYDSSDYDDYSEENIGYTQYSSTSDNFGAAASLVPDDYYEFYDTSSYYRDQPATDKINSDKLDNISDYEDSNEHKKFSKATSEHRTRHGKEESYDREKHKERLASELARLIQINNEIKKEQESKGNLAEASIMKRSQKSLLSMTSSATNNFKMSSFVSLLALLTYSLNLL